MKEFLFTRAIQAESYEQKDMKQYARRIRVQGSQLSEKDKTIDKQSKSINNCEEVVKSQNDLIDHWKEEAEKERKRRVRGKKVDAIIVAAAFIVGTAVK